MSGATHTGRRQARTDIPLAPFQERARVLLARGETLSDMAVRADMLDRRGTGDARWMSLALGFTGYVTRGRRYQRTHVTDELASKLCRALDVDPWEMGC